MRNKPEINPTITKKTKYCSFIQIYNELQLLDLRLKVELLKSGSGDNTNPEQALDENKLIILDREIAYLEKSIRQRVIQHKNEGTFLFLEHIYNIFTLSTLEKNIIITCLAAELDTKFQRSFGYLQDDMTKKRPTLDLILRLYCPQTDNKISWISEFFTHSRLLEYGIVKACGESADGYGEALISQCLRLDERVLDFLIGNNQVDKRHKDTMKLLLPNDIDPKTEECYESQASCFMDEIQKVLAWAEKSNNHVLINLHGPKGVGKSDAALRVCRKLGKNLILVSGFMNMKESELQNYIKSVVRESLLLTAIPLIYYGEGSNDSQTLEEPTDKLIHSIQVGIPIIFFAGEKPLSGFNLPSTVITISKKFKMPDETERKQIWIDESSKYSLCHSIDFGGLAGKFKFTRGQARNALEKAFIVALQRLGEARLIEESDIYMACRSLSRSRLEKLAARVDAVHCWQDIILPGEQMRQLKEICNQMRCRALVYGDWGFGKKLPYGKGLHAIFSGPSGTGKTMAAQIIANELQLELFRIDLSQVISKYIGETEKNLDRIFTEAETSNAILFFDEADAIFGKRSEVRDAHDRYANIETCYILQKMEEYEGVSILATNFKQNVDEAFLRRIHFSVDFPFPDTKQRKLIWESMFPGSAPLEKDIDYEFMAEKFILAGGNIKNIALNSAFFAAQCSGAIGMRHIMQAARDEYKKIGKTFLKLDFEPYCRLIDEVRQIC